MEALQDGPCAAGELAGQFALSRPAISERLTVLEHALRARGAQGRSRYYHLEAAPLVEVSEWLHPFYWRSRLGALRDLIDEESQ